MSRSTLIDTAQTAAGVGELDGRFGVLGVEVGPSVAQGTFETHGRDHFGIAPRGIDDHVTLERQRLQSLRSLARKKLHEQRQRDDEGGSADREPAVAGWSRKQAATNSGMNGMSRSAVGPRPERKLRTLSSSRFYCRVCEVPRRVGAHQKPAPSDTNTVEPMN
jgi:hypothetical protein